MTDIREEIQTGRAGVSIVEHSHWGENLNKVTNNESRIKRNSKALSNREDEDYRAKEIDSEWTTTFLTFHIQSENVTQRFQAISTPANSKLSDVKMLRWIGVLTEQLRNTIWLQMKEKMSFVLKT
jgi:hypothetical protein